MYDMLCSLCGCASSFLRPNGLRKSRVEEWSESFIKITLLFRISRGTVFSISSDSLSHSSNYLSWHLVAKERGKEKPVEERG